MVTRVKLDGEPY